VDFYFWQPILSPHQAPLLSALALRWGVRVTVIADEDVPEARRMMGWGAPDYGRAVVLVAPSQADRARVIEASATDSIHVVSGLGAYPSGAAVTVALRGLGRRVWIASESWDPRGIKGLFRRLRYLKRSRMHSSAVDVVLAIGTDAELQFRMLGYPSERVVPWGYFPDVAYVPPSRPNEWTSLYYVGTVSKMKGLYDLLLSLPKTNRQIRLSVLGDGPDTERCRSFAKQRGLAEDVKWLGFVPNRDIGKHLSSADAVVIPSRYDGWAAVANEALLCGSQVIVSDACGSRALAGRLPVRVYPSGDPGRLALLLDPLRPLTLEERSRNRDLALKTISPAIAAAYFHGLATSPVTHRPGPPWLP